MRYKLFIILLFSIFTLKMTAQETIGASDSITSISHAVSIIVNEDSESGKKAVDYLASVKADRRLMAQMKAIISLNDENPIVRKSSYTLLSGINEDYVTGIFKRRMECETEPELKEMAKTGYFKMTLLKGDHEAQKEALGYFENKKNSETLNVLTEYTAGSASESNIAAAEGIMKSIRRREKAISVFQNLFSGLSLGSILILVALGLSIIYGLAGVINMSHGEFLMIGAYTTYCIQELFIRFLPESWFDTYFFVSLPISFFVAGLVGLLLERLIIRHLYSRPLESLLATLGISLILIQIARNIFGDLTSVKAPSLLSGGVTLFDGFVLPYNRLFIIALTIVVVLAMYFTFQRTSLGIKIRAVTQNRNMSACVGISTKRIDAMTFFIGSGIAGVAGCALTLIGNVVPNMGQTYIVDSFLVVVTGGVGKLVGCITSGLGIGTLSKVFEIFFETIYGKVIMLALIIFFLQYKPKGLFPDKGRIGDD